MNNGLNTPKSQWHILNQASASVTALDDLSASTDYYLAYGTTWDTSSIPHAAQNFSKKPSVAVRIPDSVNGILLRFLVANADNENTSATLWLWDETGQAFDKLIFSVIQAGTSVQEVNPGDYTALTLFLNADTVTISTDNTGDDTAIEGSTNGIAEVGPIDVQGAAWMFMDFKTDGGGSESTDAIALWKGF